MAVMTAGTGRGPITQDGCSVELYRRLGSRDEAAAFISEVIEPSSWVLDLGAGTGGIADPLSRLGHGVVAVDNSADMLAAVQTAEPILSNIETFRDVRRFDAVLLASHLINTPDAHLRRGLLTTVGCHLNATGRAFIEWHRPEWFDGMRAGQTYIGTFGAVISTLEVTSADRHQLSATVSYSADGEQWRQSFTAQRLTIADLVHELDLVGLALLDEQPFHGDWVLARARST